MKLPNEQLAGALSSVSDVFNTLQRPDGNKPHWFISFGALLYFIRDLEKGKLFEQDIDISVMYGEIDRDALLSGFESCGYKLHHELLDNHYHKPLQMVFEPNGTRNLGPYSIDIFFWVMGNEYAYHSYDLFGNNSRTLGIYTFKGTPKNLIQAETIQYVWEEIAPTLNFPVMYGSLLDVWYPPSKDENGMYLGHTGWRHPNRQFGQSKAPVTTDLVSCHNMQGQLR